MGEKMSSGPLVLSVVGSSYENDEVVELWQKAGLGALGECLSG